MPSNSSQLPPPYPGFLGDPYDQGMRQAYSTYLTGLRSVARSLDVPVGLTPKEEVWRLNKSKLYYYTPTLPPEKRYPVPLLLVYALINKPFIFDLAPGRSFIEYLVERGFEVFLLDWGAPGPEDKDTRLDDYVTQYLTRAVRRMLRVTGATEFSMLGYCIGATLAVTYAGLYPQAPLRNLLLLTAPLDFENRAESSMAVWLDEKYLDVDKLVDSVENVPGELIRFWAKMLKPMENFVGSYVTLWKQVGDEAAVRGWQAVNRWVEDVIPFAGEAFRQFVKEFIWENRLIRNELVIDDQEVNLANIDAAFLNVIAKYDHLVAYEQSASIMEAISSQDKELRVIPSTHVGLMASHRAKDKLWPGLVDWLAPRSGARGID